MKILVLIKYSLDISEIKVDPASHALRLEGVPEKIGQVDRNAVEAALRLKVNPDDLVQVLCLGPEAAKDGFRDVLAMGADEATLVIDPFGGQAEAGTAVRILEAAIRKLGVFDLILCGFASDDGYTYQTGPRLAERLDLPLVSYARSLSISDGLLKADRDLEERIQTVEAPLPALVSIAEEAFPPRRTTLLDALKAKKKPVNIWTVEASLGLSPAGLENKLEQEMLSQTGIVVLRKQQMFKGLAPAEMADQIINALVQDGILAGAA